FSFLEEDSVSPAFPAKVRVPNPLTERDALSVARTGKHLVRRSVDGSGMDRSELGLKQCSFHHTIQILRVCDFCAFTSPPAFPPCYCPLRLSTSGKAGDLRETLRLPG